MVWTDHDEHLIFSSFHSLVGSARDELLMATWDASSLAEKPHLVLNPLRDAVGRGVRCRLLTRIRNRVPRSRENMQKLAAVGVEIYADPSNHAKGVVADGTRRAIFSANLDCRHGLDEGIEVGLTLTDGPTLADFIEYLETSIEMAPTQFVACPTHRELSSRLMARNLSPWGWGQRLGVRAEAGTRAAFLEATRGDAVSLFEEEEDGTIRLTIGTRRFLLERRSQGMVGMSPTEPGRSSSRLLLDTWLSENQPVSKHHGICDALFYFEDG